jgi:xanthine/uracil/vitamin C permease (AzgA family)
MPDDPMIESAEEAERAAKAANLFDVRRFIGGLFAIYGLILTVLGIGASDEEIDKAAGVNVNLWTGLAMLAVAALFLVWAFTRPVGEELAEKAPGPGPGGDGEGAGGQRRAGAE